MQDFITAFLVTLTKNAEKSMKVQEILDYDAHFTVLLEKFNESLTGSR